MLKLKARGLKEAAERRHEQADRAEVPSGAGQLVEAALSKHTTDVGEDSGRLAASLVPGHPEHFFRAYGSTFEYGSAVPYAKFYFGRAGIAPVQPAGVEAAGKVLKGWILDGK